MEFAPEGPKAIPLWINGRAFLTASQSFYILTDSVSGDALWRVPLSGAAEAAEAVAAARAAQASWAAMGMVARRVCLSGLAKALDRYTGHFAKLLVQECAIDQEQAVAQVEQAVQALEDFSVGDTGVCGLVLDANRPLAGFVAAATPALLAGATLVVKPSVKAPSAVLALCELSSRADWPAGILNVVHGDTAAIEGLCGCDIDRLVYAGNSALGEQVRTIAEAAEMPFEMHAA